MTPSSPESPQISSISTQAYQREILLLCHRTLPACLGFFLIHFTPSFWSISSVWACFQLTFIHYVLSQVVPSLKNTCSALLCCKIKQVSLNYMTYADRVWDKGRALEQVCRSPIQEQLWHRLAAREVPAIFWHWCLVLWKHLPSWFTVRVLHWVKTHDTLWKARSESWVTALCVGGDTSYDFLFVCRGIATFYTLLEIFPLFYFRAVLTFKFMQLLWLNLSQHSGADCWMGRTAPEIMF